MDGSLACWLGLDAASRAAGWRGPWAPIVWWTVAGLMVLSVLRFFLNPPLSLENVIIVIVLGLYVGNARRFRLLLAPPPSTLGAGRRAA